MNDVPIRMWTGEKVMAGRHIEAGMDNKALAYWLYGLLRNECATPSDAREVVLQVLTHIHKQFFDMDKTGSSKKEPPGGIQGA
jgi:hypothetical protein